MAYFIGQILGGLCIQYLLIRLILLALWKRRHKDSSVVIAACIALLISTTVAGYNLSDGSLPVFFNYFFIYLIGALLALAIELSRAGKQRHKLEEEVRTSIKPSGKGGRSPLLWIALTLVVAMAIIGYVALTPTSPPIDEPDIESSTDSQGLPKRIEKPISTTPKARGEFGEFERFMKEFMDQLASQSNDYLLELEAIGWNSILDANRIKADKTFVESKVIIQKAKEVMKKNTNINRKLIDNAKDNIRSLTISESSKRDMLAGFEHGIENAKENRDAILSLEGKMVNEIENIMTLLSAKKGAWVVDGEQILFYNDSDLEQFNSYIASIQSIVKQVEAIQRQSVQTANRNFDRMKEKMR